MINELLGEPNFEIKGVKWEKGHNLVPIRQHEGIHFLQCYVSEYSNYPFFSEGVLVDSDEKFEAFIYKNHETLESELLSLMCVAEYALIHKVSTKNPKLLKFYRKWERVEKLTYLGLQNEPFNIIELVEVYFMTYFGSPGVRPWC